MADIKLTAVEGLKASGGEDPWEDFLSEEEIKKIQETEKKPTVTETKTEKEAEDFKGKSADRAEETESESEDGTKRSSGRGSPIEQGTDKPVDTEKPSEKKSKKKIKRKKSKSPSRSRPVIVHNRVDHSKDVSSKSKDRTFITRGVSKDQDRQRGRKLHRPRQPNKFHSVDLEQAVEQSSRECLEQKFEELEELMTRPLADTRGRISRQRVQKMVNMQHCHVENGHGGDVCEEEDPDRQAYSTIRILQTTGPSVHLQIHNHRRDSPRSTDSPHAPLSPKPSRSQRRRGSVESPTTSSSGRSNSNEDRKWVKESIFDHYSSEGDDRSGDESPARSYKPTDMHLKHSDNPTLLKWLKRKDAEHRRARRAERKKKREERNDKMVEMELQIARREKSAERVKKWLEVKRKEAAIRQKAERQHRKQEEREQKALRAKSQESGLQGTRIDRPRTAPTQKSSYRLIKRPSSAATARLDEGEGSACKPPDSKFLHKRSVTGRVQLMKIQNERNAMVRSADQQRYAQLSFQERQKKVKTSYDDWLIAKKKQDLEKQKAAKRQKELMKSDPEMERIIPELARRRIERIKNGKRSLDTGLRRNTASSGEEVEEGDQQQGAGNENVQSKPPSYKLAVSGVAATMAEPKAPTRPASAKTRQPVPRKAVSPKRPQSAKPASSTSRTEESTSASSPYKLPFPDDLGVPHHVKRVQERIFSKELNSQSGNSERPEPQGCAAVESAANPQGGDDGATAVKTEMAGMVLLREIEKAAVESEGAAEEATLIAVQNAVQSAATRSVEQSAGSEGESAEQAVAAAEEGDNPEPEEQPGDGDGQGEEEQTAEAEKDDKAEEGGQLEDCDGIDENCPDDESDDAVEGEETVGNDNDETLQKDRGENEEADESNAQEEVQMKQQQAEVFTLAECEENVEESQQEARQEASEQQTLQEPLEQGGQDPGFVDEQAAEMMTGTEEDAGDQADEQTTAQPDASEDNQTDCKATPEAEEDETGCPDLTELEGTPEKLAKRVSFSQELTTVFEPGSTDASSNYEDDAENITGYEGEEDDGATDWNASLDDVPDPV